MRHRKNKLKLSRPRSQREALKNLLVRNLLLQERIKTTLTKAKIAGRFADKLITLAKRDNLSSRRQAYTILKDHSLVKHLFSYIAPRFKDKKGGYTRILKLSYRKGDGASLALAELTLKSVPQAESKKAAAVEPKQKKPQGEEKKKPQEKKTKAKKGLKRLFRK